MSAITRFLRFWYDFIVGDDWTIALGVVIAVGIAALLAQQHIQAWWLILIAVIGLLGASLWRVTRPPS